MERLQVLYEDNHLIAVSKPAGVLAQGDDTRDPTLGDYVKDYIKVRYNKPGAVFLGVIHRLDRPVSGLVLFARTSKGLERMNRLFKERRVEKTYWALTASRPDPLSGHLTHYILKDRQRNIARAFPRPSNRNKGAKKSELHYEMVAEIHKRCLIELRPLTGRPHQIRVQLAKIGCPIVGDLKYGYDHPNPDGRIHLHCRELAFRHPVTDADIRIRAELPEDPLWNDFAELQR